MKLWEHMLNGAKQGPQVFNAFFGIDEGSCAMGAVAKSTGIASFRLADGEDLCQMFPELRKYAECPEKNDNCIINHYYRYSLSNVIVCLNDHHRWSRQRIAEWLANRELKFTESKTVNRVESKPVTELIKELK
jgi:hypothetical protein